MVDGAQKQGKGIRGSHKSKAEFLTLKLILVLALLAPFTLASTASASSTSISVSLDPVQSSFTAGSVSQLEKFHLADIDVVDGAGNYTAADVAKLKAGGSIVIS
ncbi:MAG: hypothetical protein M1309_05425 [Actinobacteria bacterium]|nr:hypothetical protein [Actinomycetota bacterium]